VIKGTSIGLNFGLCCLDSILRKVLFRRALVERGTVLGFYHSETLESVHEITAMTHDLSHMLPARSGRKMGLSGV
jgi:hypothetical protein